MTLPLQATNAHRLQAVVFDWAGTIIDFGSRAPADSFVQLFALHQVAISLQEARVPMGLPKYDHIVALSQLPRVATAWQQVHHKPFDEHDAHTLYDQFTPINAAAVLDHADLIPGALDTVAQLRTQGLRIGSTTGYNRAIMNVVVPLAAQHGFKPDNLVCADDISPGRPSAMGMYRCFADLNVWPAHTVVKVDDTLPGLWEGHNALCWTVGITVSGNEVGLSPQEWAALSLQDQQALKASAALRLKTAQPDYVVDSVADLMPVIQEINARLARGERPCAQSGR